MVTSLHTHLFFEARESWTDRNSTYLPNPETVARTLVSRSEVEIISQALSDNAIDVTLHDLSTYDRRALTQVIANIQEPSVIWNLSDGQHRFLGSLIPAMARLYKLPFLGSSTYAQGLCCAKHHWKAILSRAGLSTPNWTTINDLQDMDEGRLKDLEFPVFVKSADLGNNAGLSATSPICYDRESAIKNVREMLRLQISPVLVEEFCPGTEFSVCAINMDKWELGIIQKEYVGDFVSTPMKDEEEDCGYREWLLETPPQSLLHTASQAISLLGIEDYVRFDIRTDKQGRPNLLDINSGAFLTSDTFSLFLHNIAIKQGLSSARDIFKDLVLAAYDRQSFL